MQSAPASRINPGETHHWEVAGRPGDRWSEDPAHLSATIVARDHKSVWTFVRSHAH